MSVRQFSFPTRLHEFCWIAEQVRELIENKQIEPQEIAIISRKHETLKEIVEIFHKYKIPIFYERGQNVMDQPHICQLKTILKFVYSLNKPKVDEADELLPEILGYPFWCDENGDWLSELDIWKISVASSREWENGQENRSDQIYGLGKGENNHKKLNIEKKFSGQKQIQSSAEQNAAENLSSEKNSRNKKPKPWLKIMLEADELPQEYALSRPEKVKQIAQFLIYLAKYANFKTAPQLIDLIIGVDDNQTPEETNEEFENQDKEMENLHSTKLDFKQNQHSKKFGKVDFEEIKQQIKIQQSLFEIPENHPQMQFINRPLDKHIHQFRSPFKKFHFDRKLKLEKHEIDAEYLNFLSGIRVLIEAIRSYKTRERLMLSDLIDFFELLEKNKLPLIDKSPFNKSDQAVNLLTAHKAKGLEFDTVFVICCQQNEWLGKPHGYKLDLPANLPLMAEPDEMDDKLRLFYVAITRAKNWLYLTGYKLEGQNKESMKIEFLPDNWENVEISAEQNLNYLQQVSKSELPAIFSGKQKSLLSGLLSSYKLSVTHLLNFLNVSDGGPKTFLEKNLLRFPQTKIISGSYGTAMHAALNRFYNLFKKTKTLPSVDFLLQSFEQCLADERLSEHDFDRQLQKGREKLQIYFEHKKDCFKLNSKLEVNFKSQGSSVGEAEISGQIDKMDFDDENKTIKVVDFKTGKAAKTWTGKNTDEKIKLWKYGTQLDFYKLLVESSRDYANYKVVSGQLEFLEADKDTGQILCLEKEITTENVEKLGKLIEVVFAKIMNLDFPDISKYSADLSGIEAFTKDLLEGKS